MRRESPDLARKIAKILTLKPKERDSLEGEERDCYHIILGNLSVGVTSPVFYATAVEVLREYLG